MTTDENINLILAKLNIFEERMNTLETELHKIRQQTNNIDLIIENEIRSNILQLAKSHHNLSNIIYYVAPFRSETEVLSLKINILESDIRNLKDTASKQLP